jgi:hypothetical protein
MTDGEQNAARENAMLSINQQANAKLRSVGNQAAGNGLRGGVVAGEQAQIAGGAQSAYAAALRELMGKVQGSQVDASSELGNTLTSARGTEQSAQSTNINAATGELQGRLSTPFDLANVVDAANTNDRIETNAGTVRREKADSTEADLRDEQISRDDILEEEADNKLKTGNEGIDNSPQNVFARANGYSSFADMPDSLRAEWTGKIGTNAGTTEADQIRVMNDPGNKTMRDKLIADAKRRRKANK